MTQRLEQCSVDNADSLEFPWGCLCPRKAVQGSLGCLGSEESVLMALFFCPKVLSDEVKRKQYDAYGTASFDPGATGAGAGRQYWSSGPSIDPEELFRKIFGEFSGSSFGDFQNVFDQPQEVRNGCIS